ncbi:MAG: hypothetical protein ACYTBX_01920 [Planctomycetota bacterium]
MSEIILTVPATLSRVRKQKGPANPQSIIQAIEIAARLAASKKK